MDLKIDLSVSKSQSQKHMLATAYQKISLKSNFCYSFSPMNFPTFFGKFLFIAHIRQLPLVVLLQHTISYIKSCTNSHKKFLEPFLNYFYRFFIYNLQKFEKQHHESCLKGKQNINIQIHTTKNHHIYSTNFIHLTLRVVK